MNTTVPSTPSRLELNRARRGVLRPEVVAYTLRVQIPAMMRRTTSEAERQVEYDECAAYFLGTPRGRALALSAYQHDQYLVACSHGY